MVSQTSFSGAGEMQGVAGVHEDYFGYMDRDWRLCCSKAQQSEADARSDGSGRTVDEATDLEALAYMAATDDSYVDKYDSQYDEYCSPRGGSSNVSGLPLVCSNCGVSFFSLQIPDDQVDCYCSGECKWSVIMYREMDLRMYTMRRRPARRHTVHSTTRPPSSIYGGSDDEERDDGSVASFSFSDDSTASSSCS